MVSSRTLCVAVLCAIWSTEVRAGYGSSQPVAATRTGTLGRSAQAPDMLRFLRAAQTWQSGFVCLCKVSEAQSRDGRAVPGVVTLMMEDDFSDTPAPSDFIVPAWAMLSFGTTSPTQCSPGGVLLLWVGIEGRVKYPVRAIYSVPIQPGEEANGIVASLRAIQEYRRSSSDASAERLLSSSRDLPVEYVCTQWILERHQVTTKEKELLVELRDSNSLLVRTRLMASRARAVNDRSYEKEHLQWLRSWCDKPRHMDAAICKDLLDDIRARSGGEFEEVDLPRMVALLDSRDLGDEEAVCVLRWLAEAGADKSVRTDTLDKVTRLVLKRALEQTDRTRAQIFLFSAEDCIRDLMSSLLQARTMQANRAKALVWLEDYQRIAEEGRKNAKNAGVQRAIDGSIEFIKESRKNVETVPKD